jgi:DNA-binding transcriptional regulator LsrR (DeoR family)
MAWIAVLLILPIIVLLWATETRNQRALRLRRRGWTQRQIATHMGISRSTVQRIVSVL